VGGGGLYGCDGRIENNAIVNNSAVMGGGLAFCDGLIRSNVIAYNSADTTAGGMARCDGFLLNNTIYGNSAGLHGGGLYRCLGGIVNCIIWANRATGLGDQLHESSSPSFSCIEEWVGGGTENTDADPLFLAPEGGDFRLTAGSPCIDTGGEPLLSPGLDLDGKLRIVFGERALQVDMGAYEYNSEPFAVSQVALVRSVPLAGVGSESLRLTWKSQPNDTYTLWTCEDILAGTWTRVKGVRVPSQGASTSLIFSISAGRVALYEVGME